MGLGIILTDYTGQIFARVDDPKNFLHKLLPPAHEKSGSVLSKIDWYGDTYFNYCRSAAFSRSGIRWRFARNHPKKPRWCPK